MTTQLTRSGPSAGRHHRHQRGVDPAREAEHDRLEAVLLHVVADAQHERLVDLAFFGMGHDDPLLGVALRGPVAVRAARAACALGGATIFGGQQQVAEQQFGLELGGAGD